MNTPIRFPPSGDLNHAGIIAYRHKRKWVELASIIGKTQSGFCFEGSDTALIPVIFPQEFHTFNLGHTLHATKNRGELHLGLGLYAFLSHVIPDVAPEKLNRIAFRPNLMQSVRLIDLFSEGN